MAYYGQNVAAVSINFNGTGTISINDSFNVTSIFDRGTGRYTVNYDDDFTNTNYSGCVGAEKVSGTDDGYCFGCFTHGGYGTGSCDVSFQIGSAGPDDVTKAFVHLFSLGNA